MLNLSTEVRVGGRFDPVEVYLRLHAETPLTAAAFSESLERRWCAHRASSSSGRSHRTITTHPVKGTVPRRLDAHEDALAARNLAGDDKERAENLMVVDLMRNDFARVSEFGEVEVPHLFRVETHPHIHQLVNSATGRLKPALDVVELLRHAFPPGR